MRSRRLGGLGVCVAVSIWPQPPRQSVPDPGDLTSLPLEELLQIKVEGAALHPQSLQEAPASVTVLTAADLYKYGYRTLQEALTSVRGFYGTNDRTYRTIGVRGFGLPGDYASRILVMVNGHNMADNVFDSMLWFGVDFPIDMELIKRIEVIRGPSSALYGSNGILATVNIITKSPEEVEPAQMIAGTGSFGEKKAQLMSAVPLGREAKALVSGSVFQNAGESPLWFPQLATGAAGSGEAIRMDGESGYHLFSTVTWRNWDVTAAVSRRTKIQPISWGDTVFNDRGTKVMEPSAYLEGTYTRRRDSRIFRWRTYYSATHLRGRFDYPLDSGVEDNRSCSCGDWIGTQLTYRLSLGRFGSFTAGTEAKADLRVLQWNRDVSPVPVEYVNINQRDQSGAAFGQAELALSPVLTLDLGLRVDASAYRRSFVSPRAALIYRPTPASTYKLLYGRAFRNPSAFHLFYEDGLAAVSNRNLRPENADTIEVNVERTLGKRVTLLTAAYAYRLRDFLTGVYTPDGLLQYQNLGGMNALGMELEINGRPTRWLETTASYAVQRARDSLTDRTIPNSANHQAKFRAAVPVGRKFSVSHGFQYYSSRGTYAGASLDPICLADFTLSTRDLSRNFDIRAGIRNAFNWKYSDPIALNARVDSMQQPGRAFFVELIAHAGR